MRRTPRRLAALATTMTGALLLAACGASGGDGADPVDPGDWSSVLARADGQTVHWYLYGGDDVLNAFVTEEVEPRLAKLGVALDPVPVTDTGEAVNKVLGEKQAGRTTGGAVDAIWINGENFATGAQADLWYCGWAGDLPNAKYVDADADGVTTDFGVPVRGCESVWQQASSALVYDSDDLSTDDVASVDSLLAWAKAHPGRFTYPAPPDFTGSMAVRSLLYGELGGPDRLTGAFDEQKYAAATKGFYPLLNSVEPTLWRKGRTYPSSQDAVEKLYADGEISAFFSYGPGSVAAEVSKGTYPASTREAVLASGNISNLLPSSPSPTTRRTGPAPSCWPTCSRSPPFSWLCTGRRAPTQGSTFARTSAAQQRAFAAVQTSPSVLDPDQLTADAQPELGSAYLRRIEKDWRTKVLQQ